MVRYTVAHLYQTPYSDGCSVMILAENGEYVEYQDSMGTTITRYDTDLCYLYGVSYATAIVDEEGSYVLLEDLS